MNTRKLSLRRETLVELTNDDLRSVVGATHVTCPTPTHGATSCDACPTVPINECLSRIIQTIAIETGGC